MEEYILSKIDQRLTILMDMATVPEPRMAEYEPIRGARITKFIERDEPNIWVTSHGFIRDVLDGIPAPKTDKIDWIFPPDKIGHYMNVPNSVTLLIAYCLYGQASQIIIFGLDGYVGDVEKGLASCYKPEEIAVERLLALGHTEDGGINRDSFAFEQRLPEILGEYRKLFKNNCSIWNCSPRTIYSCLPKTNYRNVHRIIQEKR